MAGVREMYAIYDNALDYPGQIVVRCFMFNPLGGKPIPVMNPVYVGHDLEAARDSIPGRRHRLRFPREHRDHPSVVETWL